MQLKFILILLFSFLVSPLYAASFDCSEATTETVNAICTSAYEGDVDAQFEFGKLFASGEIIVGDYKQAAFWFSKAAEQDHSGAQWVLGLMYDHGEGVEQNYERAVYWYTKSADQGDARAQNDLGLMYYNGKGVKQDYDQVRYWFSKAAEQGHAKAQYRLGIMYEYGEGVEQNYDQAADWYTKAAEQGIEGAPFKLESIQFEKPYGQLKSGYYFEAVAAFQKNAEIGNPISVIYLFFTLDEKGMDKFEPVVADACNTLEDNFSKYLYFWENDAPLHAASAACHFDKSLLGGADLEDDPFAMLLKGIIPSINQDRPLSNQHKALDIYMKAALVGYCPAMFFSAGLYLNENSDAMIKPSPTIAYAWNLVTQKFGCPVTLFESDFDNYSNPDQEFAQNLADDILKMIRDNIRELQKL